MVVLESIYVAGLGYSAYNAWLMGSFYHKAKATGEGLQCAASSAHGLELYGIKTNYAPPVYINSGGTGSIGIPVGGGTYNSREFVYSRWRCIGGGKNELFDYMRGSHDSAVVKTWINTSEELTNLCAQHQIAQGTFPVKFPVRALRFHWNGPVWYDLPSGAISPNRNWVALKAAQGRMRPFAVPVMFLTSVLTIGAAVMRH